LVRSLVLVALVLFGVTEAVSGRNDLIVTALLKAAEDPSPDVRVAAARALGSFKDQRTIAALRTLLQQDKESFIRDAAAESLARLGDKTIGPDFIQELTKPEPPGPVFSGNNTAAQELFYQQHVEKKTKLISGLGALREAKAVAAIVTNGLAASDLSLRVTSALALGRIGGEDAARALANLLEKEYRLLPPVKGHLIEAHVPAVASPSVQQSPYLRSAVVWALGEIGLPLAKPVLHKALQDHNSIVRDQARYALDRIR
jgi:HEAT repeat protein